MKQKPKFLIGIDVSRGALSSAATLGYVPIYADAGGHVPRATSDIDNDGVVP